VPSVLGKIAFLLGLLTLGLALRNRGAPDHRLASIVLATAILLGTLRFVIAVSTTVATLLSITALLLAVTALWRFFQVRRS